MKYKLRSHPLSIITNNTFFNIFFVFISFDLINNIKILTNLNSLIDYINSLGIVAVLFGPFIIILFFIISIIKWRVNYIEFDGDNISLKNTGIFKKEFNFKISDIASINIKRNLLERLFNLSTIKIEVYNTVLSYDDKISYTFKKEIAEKIASNLETRKEELLSEKEPSDNILEINSQKSKNSNENLLDFNRKFNIKDGFYFSLIKNFNILNILNFSIIFFLFIIDKNNDIFNSKNIIIFIVLIAFSLLKFINNFLSYGNFSISKNKNKITIKHGVLKIKESSFNLNKVTGIKITYSILGRILKKPYIEAIVVGLNDDKEDTSLISLAIKEEEVELYIKNSLQNFNIEGEIIKENKYSYLISFIKSTVVFLISLTSFILIWKFILHNPLNKISFYIILSLTIIFIFFLLILYLKHKQAFLKFNSELITVKDGLFSILERRYLLKKVQFIEIKTSPLERLFSLASGNIHSIADIKDSVLAIPRVKKENLENLSKELK